MDFVEFNKEQKFLRFNGIRTKIIDTANAKMISNDDAVIGFKLREEVLTKLKMSLSYIQEMEMLEKKINDEKENIHISPGTLYTSESVDTMNVLCSAFARDMIVAQNRFLVLLNLVKAIKSYVIFNKDYGVFSNFFYGKKDEDKNPLLKIDTPKPILNKFGKKIKDLSTPFLRS
ncbi:MAG TPA: hypothetical protein VKM55_24410 [Candidatus Lokiarchaeia archaeon]|nr:hypothetical protein [Candidatus Lokiarchaeia archaeon]